MVFCLAINNGFVTFDGEECQQRTGPSKGERGDGLPRLWSQQLRLKTLAFLMPRLGLRNGRADLEGKTHGENAPRNIKVEGVLGGLSLQFQDVYTEKAGICAVLVYVYGHD